MKALKEFKYVIMTFLSGVVVALLLIFKFNAESDAEILELENEGDGLENDINELEGELDSLNDDVLLSDEESEQFWGDL